MCPTRHWSRVLGLLVGALAGAGVAACTDDRSPAAEPARPGGQLGVVEVVADDLDGPTQFVFDRGDLIVAQLNGGENDGTGQILEVGPSGDRRVLYDNLDKPTGVLVRGDEIWIMERTRLSRGPRDGGPLTVVADQLPNNGRSQGTLTLTPDGDVLFNTSGAQRDGMVRDRSGRLWVAFLDGDETGDAVTVAEYAAGFKHAYAHVFGPDGTLWTTEVSDGRFDGQAPADEVVAVTPGVDHGWPRCVGDNRPVIDFGVTDCSGIPSSLAVFDPGATPTGIIVSPFNPERLLVALWVTGQVVAVPVDGDGSPTVVIDRLLSPQHLVADGGLLYLAEFGQNRIVRLG